MTEIVWATISELARQHGVKPQSMRERVYRLAEKHGGLTRKRGRNVMVDIARFELAVGADGDAVRETARETGGLMDGDGADEAPETGNRFRDAQTQRALIDARIKALDLAEMQGQVVAVDGPHGVQVAMRQVAEKQAQRLKLLPRAAQDMFDDGLVSDQAAARRFLRAIADDLLRKMASDMRALSLEGGATEPGDIVVTVDGVEVAQ